MPLLDEKVLNSLLPLLDDKVLDVASLKDMCAVSRLCNAESLYMIRQAIKEHLPAHLRKLWENIRSRCVIKAFNRRFSLPGVLLKLVSTKTPQKNMHCDTCNMWLRSPLSMADHFNGKKHKKNRLRRQEGLLPWL